MPERCVVVVIVAIVVDVVDPALMNRAPLPVSIATAGGPRTSNSAEATVAACDIDERFEAITAASRGEDWSSARPGEMGFKL